MFSEGRVIFEGPTVFVNNTSMGLGGAINSLIDLIFLDTAEFRDNSGREGGAIRAIESLKFSKSPSIFTNNHATDGSGGAIFWADYIDPLGPGPALHLINFVFEGNSATLRGGAVAASACDALFLVNTTMTSNSAVFGGALSSLNCPVGWFDSTASDNLASGRGGALELILAPMSPPLTAPWLYALFSTSYTSSITQNVQFSGNQAGGGGGAIFADSSNILINTCDFFNSSALSGGSVYIGSFLQIEMNNCTIDGSVSTSSGGGIYLGVESTLTATDCQISNTHSGASGMAVRLYYTEAALDSEIAVSLL